MKKNILLIALFLSLKTMGQTNLSNEIQARRSIQMAETKGQTAIAFAKSFVGKPYVAKTLEKQPEQLVCNLNELDCYTFVETVIALTNAKYTQNFTTEGVRNEIKQMRYRNGIIDGYGSRIHYFTEWILQNERGGIVRNLTKEWGSGRPKTINFMTTHPSFYAQLADKEVLNEIQFSEKQLSQQLFYEIPKANFTSVEKKIQTGDIVVFTTTVAGLDVNHEGFAIWQNGKLHLLHASLDHKKVIISTETLGQYLQNIKKHAGIMVLRLQ